MMFRLVELSLLVVLVLMFFGTGKLPRVMGELGRGISNFKRGMAGEPLEDASESRKALVGEGSPKKVSAKKAPSSTKKTKR